MRRSILGIVVLAVCLGLAVPASGQHNLVVNGGFEIGDFTGWTLSGTDTGDDVVVGPNAIPGYVPHTGRFFAALGSIGGDGFLTQTLSTTPGKTYHVGFWLASDGRVPNNFSASLGGDMLYSQTNLAAQSYTHYSFVTTASSAATVLQFAVRNDKGWLSLDDVSVRAVPEASSIVSLSIMLIIGSLALRKRMRRHANR